MLSHRSRVVLDTLLPAGAHPLLPRGAFDAGFEAFYADFARTGPRSLRLGFRAALVVAIWVAPLLIRRRPPLTLYTRATREHALDALAHSSLYALRQMVVLLKVVLCLSYGADPAVRAALGAPDTSDPRRTDSRAVRP